MDAVLVSEALLGEVVSAEYGHLPRERGTSDHSLLVVELSAGNENLTKKEK